MKKNTKASRGTTSTTKSTEKNEAKKSSGRKTTAGKITTYPVSGAIAAPGGISEMVYETAKGLYDAGAIDKTTMREFDALCLPKVPNYSPSQIRAIRNRCKLSQQVFAAYLNVSASSLQKWEQGLRKPDGLALKLLHLVDKKGLQTLVV